MPQPSYSAAGTKPLRTDSRRMKWQRILGVYQNRPGAKAANNPLRTDTVWRTKYKILRAIGGASSGQTFPPSGGGGGGGPTADPDVNKFLACASTGDPTIIAALVTLVTGLKAANLWNSFNAIYPFVGGNSGSHACNLYDANTFQITWHGSVTHNANGITGDGLTGYGDTGFTPSINAGVYNLNNASIGVYCRSASVGNNQMFMGCAGNSVTAAMVTSAGSVFVDGLNTNSAAFIAAASFNGNIICTKTGVSTQSLYTPTASGSTTVSGTPALPNTSFLVLAYNNGGGGPALFTSANLAFAFIGAGFSASDIATIQNLVTQFQTTLGRA